MRLLRAWFLRLAGAAGCGRQDSQIAEELQTHLALLAERYVQTGMAPAAARQRAAAEFGSVAAVADAYRDRRGWPSLEEWVRNLRMGARSLVRTPVLSLSMVLVLGLGVGLATAIVSVFHSMAWETLPVAAPHAVVRIGQQLSGEVDRRIKGHPSLFSYPELATYQRATRTLAAIAGSTDVTVAWRENGAARPLDGVLVTGDYFKVLPAVPSAGRTLVATDSRESVAVIAHGLWTGTYGSRHDIVGRVMWLDGSPFTIVGVAPPSFAFSISAQSPPSFWIPLEAYEAGQGRQVLLEEANVSWLQVVGRLGDGVGIETARTEAAVIGAELARDYPGRRTSIDIRRAARIDTAGFQSKLLTTGGVLAAFLGIVFLICGSNAAGLLMARDAARQKEIAVRVALGAGRSDIVRQLGAELFVVAAASALVGVGVCMATLRLLARVVPMEDMLLHPDARTFGLAFATALAVAALFGLAPLRQTLRVDCLQHLKGDLSMFGAAHRSMRLRQVLVAIQVGTSLFLLIVATLLGRGVAQVWRSDPGYVTAGLYAILPDSSLMPAGDRLAARGVGVELASRLRSAPGILSVGHVATAPFFGRRMSQAGTNLTGALQAVYVNQVDEAFFGVLGVQFVAGRPLLQGEADATIVNERLARMFWQDPRAAIGQVLFVPQPERNRQPQPMRVVGVVPAVQTMTIGIPDEPTYYTLIDERRSGLAWLMVRTDGRVPLERLTTDAITSIHPDAGAFVSAIDARLSAATASLRVGGVIAGTIGLLALVVAAVGVHGVISYTVAARVRDIGVYQALGARPNEVLGLILTWTLRGVAIGASMSLGLLLLVGLAFGRSALPLLNGVSPLDVPSFGLGLLLLAIVIGLAAYVPASRALAITPFAALRRDV